MTLQEFISAYSGRGLDFDGYYGDQCVDLAQFYNRDVLGNGARFTGNAVDIFGQQSDKFDWIGNTPEGVPGAGDIVIWEGQLNGGPGHVAVFVSGNTSEFTSFDQNWPTGSSCHLQHHTYNYVKGWGRLKQKPKEQDMISADQVKDLYRILLGREASQDEADQWASNPQGWPNVFYGIKDSAEGNAHAGRIVQDAHDAAGVPLLHTQLEAEEAKIVELNNKVALLSSTPVVVPTKPTPDPIIVPVTKELPMEDLKSRLSSRKLWIAVVSAVGFALHGDTNAAVAVIFAYFGANVLDK